MNISTRQRAILDWLHDGQPIGTEQIADRFGVSAQTIRRDVQALSDLGLVRRQHGSVALPASQHNLSFAQRRDAQVERKRGIARAAASQLPEDATVFLGYGTTVAEFARALPPDRALRVVTNNLDAAIALADKPAVETWLAGGRLRPRDRDTMGSWALDAFARFRPHVAVIGIGGIAADGALMEFQPDEADLTRGLLERSAEAWLLADGSKHLRDAPCLVAPLTRITRAFTDADAPEALDVVFDQAGVPLHRC